MTTSGINLLQAFQAVSQVMGENQDSLNEADSYNHDHGDNMAEIFQVITQAMAKKKRSSPATQLAYASEVLKDKSHSGSAQLYAQGLSQASQQVQGKAISSDQILPLIQALLGGQQSAEPSPTPASDPTGGLIGSLLSGFLGGTGSEQAAPQGGLDANDLLSAGMAFLQSRQQGESGLNSLVDALMDGSKINESSHRSQSGKLVANTLLQVLGGALKQ
jgi:hypothetical protein